jgi:hypothetical protein
VLEIDRPGNLDDLADLGLRLPDGKQLLSQVQQVTVHLAPRQLWLIDLGRVFKGFPGYSGLPSNGICDSLQA